MNKKLVFVLTLVFVLSFAILVFADQDFNVVLDPIGDQEYSSLPQTYDVTGTIKGDGNAEINWIKLYIDGPDDNTFVYKDSYDLGNQREIGEDGRDFSIPWIINEEGSYKVKIVAEIDEDDGITKQDIESDVEISLTSEEEDGDEATENNPAAPAIANKILKEAGVKHNYGGGNYISDVAREFQGVDKTSENYEDQVRSYLENHEAWDKDTEIQDNKPGKGKGNAYGLNKEKNNNALENGNKKNK